MNHVQSLPLPERILTKKLARHAGGVGGVLLEVVRRPGVYVEIKPPARAPVESDTPGIIRFATVDLDLFTAQALVLSCRQMGI